MKNLKRIFSVIISLTMIFSLFGAFSAQAADTTGIKKWSSYQNNQNMTIGQEISRNVKDQWTLASGGDVGSKLGEYAADPDNSNNVAVKYTAYSTKTDGTLTGNQIAYYPTTTLAAGKSFTVELRLRLKETGVETNDTDTVRIVGSGGTSTAETVVFQRRSDGDYAIKLQLNNSAAYSVVSTGIAPGDWVDIKFEENATAKTAVLYINGEAIGTTVTLQDTNVDGLSYVDYKHSPNTKTVTAAPTYLDDVKITAADTTDLMYYEDFATSYNYNFLQGTGSETIDVYEEVKLVDANGEDTGYSVPIYATVTADVSKLGTFSTAADVAGFDEPINISWTVYKEQLAWQENFQGYEDSDVGKAPHLDPYANSSDDNGKTVVFDADDTNGTNKLLKYVTNTQDDYAIFTNNERIGGRVKMGYRFMVPEIYSEGSFTIPVMGYSTANARNEVLIELNVSFSSNGGRINFKKFTSPGTSDGSVDIVSRGYLEAKKWYKLDFDINLNTDTFTYSLDDIADSGEYYVGAEDLEFSQVKLAQRGKHTNDDGTTSTTLNETLTFYFDDLYVNKYLTIKEPVNETVTVYQNDTINYPEQVSVLLSDDKTTDTADVTWNGSIDTATLDTQTITGTVTGTSTPVTLTATVSPYPYEIVTPVLKNGDTEVFGLIDGGSLAAVTVKKISNSTAKGKVYAALYNGDGKLLNVNTADIPTDDTWAKDDMKDITMTLSLDVESDVNIDECSLKTYVLADSLTPYAISNTMTNTNGVGTPTIWIAGDSTAARYSDTRRPETGWAEMLKENYADAANITVQNGTIGGTGGIANTGAAGGQSSKSYVDQGRLATTLANAQPGDYLFIQFGHNDSADEEYRHTEPDTTYREYMTTFVIEARAHGVIPVIFTSIVRGRYNGADSAFNGDTHASLDDYARVAQEVAAQYHVPVVDLHKKTGDVLRNMTLEQSKQYFLYISACADADNCINEINGETNHSVWCANYPDGIADSTHLNHYGAAWVADLAMEGLKEIRLPLANLLSAE